MGGIEELCNMLEERGVEWEPFYGQPAWFGSDGTMHYAREEFTFDGPNDKLTVYHLTPKQAIAATFGAKACRLEEIDKDRDTTTLDAVRDIIDELDRIAEGFNTGRYVVTVHGLQVVLRSAAEMLREALEMREQWMTRDIDA